MAITATYGAIFAGMEQITWRILLRMAPTAAAAIFCMAVHAQVSFGVRAGVNWAKMVGNEGILGKPGTRLGPSSAIMVGIPVTPHFTLVPELGYVQRGYYRDATPPGYFPEEELVLDYADLSLLAKFHAADGPTRPYILVGAMAGRLLGARLFQTDPWTKEMQGVVLNTGQVRTSPWSEGSMNRWNAGVCAGLGFSFTAGASQVFVEGRYLLGFTDIWNDMPVLDVNGSWVGKLVGRDRSIEVNVGWMIPVGTPRTKQAGSKAP